MIAVETAVYRGATHLAKAAGERTIIHCGRTYNICTFFSAGRIRFEWDPAKAVRNLHKHGVSFTEASTVFSDEEAVLLDDPDLAPDEERFVLLGSSSSLRVLVVVHCHRDDDRTIRLISARKATRTERAQYGAHLRS